MKMSESLLKVISILAPLNGRVNESEDHYSRVHIPLVRQTLEPDPQWITYTQDRVVQQYYSDGQFLKEPDLWRLVHIRAFPVAHGADIDMHDSTSASRPNSAELTRVIELDHPNFLGGLRRFEAEETTVHCSLTRQTALVKYFILVEDPYSKVRSEYPTYTSFIDQLLVRASDCGCSLRLMVNNHILGETETTIRGNAIVPTDRRLAKTTLVGIVEMWFDNPFSAEKYFTSSSVRELIIGGELRKSAYAVRETCGFDKR